MRVVFLTHNYPRHPGDVAGGFLHPLAQALRQRGVDVRVIAPADRGEAGPGELDGVPIERIRYARAERETLAYTGRMVDALRTPGGLRAMAGLIHRFRQAARAALLGHPAAVIHAHWWVPAGLAAPRDVATVITCHGSDVRLLARNAVIRGLGRRVLRRASVVTAVSRPLADTIATLTGRELDATLIQPMPVAELERPRSIGGGGVVILGRLSDQKRIELSLDGFALARRQGLTLPLTIVGDGPARERLEGHVEHLDLGSAVQFVGAVPPGDVPRWFSRADCLLMTAEHEGLGLAAAEALMQGVPVVACHDGGGVIEVVPGGAGARVVSATPEAVAGALGELNGSVVDRDAAFLAGERWRVRLSPGFVADRCLEWYARARAA
jgi:glycosyltransferase involved in cell wall biosynthesis